MSQLGICEISSSLLMVHRGSYIQLGCLPLSATSRRWRSMGRNEPAAPWSSPSSLRPGSAGTGALADGGVCWQEGRAAGSSHGLALSDYGEFSGRVSPDWRSGTRDSDRMKTGLPLGRGGLGPAARGGADMLSAVHQQRTFLSVSLDCNWAC